MQNTSPSEYLADVRSRINSIKTQASENASYDPVADIRAAFPCMAHFASGQTMFAPRVKMSDGLGIESFIRYLASQCDGAIMRDKRGFDHIDANEGHRLAAKLGPSSRLALSSSERDWALSRCRKYREQLSAHYGDESLRILEQEIFIFPAAPDRQDVFIQHIRYNEASRSISFSLPSITNAKTRSTILTEMWALVKATGVTLAPSLSDVTVRLGKNWDRYRSSMTFLQAEPGARDLVDILLNLGYTKDERIDAALDCDATAFIKVRPDTGADYDGTRLVGYLYQIAPSDELLADIGELYEACGNDDVLVRDAVNLSKRHRYPVLRFFIGDGIIDDLEDILMRHGVQNAESARIALGDPRRSEFQHPRLKEPVRVARTYQSPAP